MTSPYNEDFKNKWQRQSIQYIANNNLNGDTVMKTLYETLGAWMRREKSYRILCFFQALHQRLQEVAIFC